MRVDDEAAMEAEDENEAMANPLHALSRAKTFYVLPTKKKKKYRTVQVLSTNEFFHSTVTLTYIVFQCVHHNSRGFEIASRRRKNGEQTYSFFDPATRGSSSNCSIFPVAFPVLLHVI